MTFLIEQDPDAMHMHHYKLGKTPLHVAVSRGASIEVVQYLLRQRPEAVGEKDAWGKTPLASLCAAMSWSPSSLDPHDDNDDDNDKDDKTEDVDQAYNAAAVLDLLMDPARICEPDRAGMLPLHIACAAGAHMDSIEALLDEFPDAIRIPDRTGRLPFHAACSNPRGATVDLLDMLATAFPGALRTFDKMGALPLHIAIQRKLPPDVILFLIDREEGAVRTREASSKMYPLHLACRAGADAVVLEKLIEIYPVAIEAVDAKGNTIFHVACTYRQLTIEFAELLLDKCSYDTIRKVNEDQSLPLHLAVQHRAAMPVLQLLIDHYPEALLCKDKKGNVPLHKAFQTATDMPILVRLAQQNHRALLKRNKRGNTPEECAPLLVQKSFRRARYWYNLRVAYCPICIRMK